MPIETFIEVGGARTRVLTDGPAGAPVAVLLHDGAWGASADVSWGTMLPLVASHYRVIAPDMLGYGGSAKLIQLDTSPYEFRARHIFALLDELGIDKAHFVGTSFGGSLILQASTQPQRAARMASASSISGTGGPWRTAKAQTELGRYDGTEADMRRVTAVLVDDFPGMDEQVHRRMRWAAEPGHYAGMLAPHISVPDALRRERPTGAYPAALKHTGVPTLVITGALDDLVEPDWMDHVTEVEPAITTCLLPTMHSPNISHPKQTWAILEPFLDANTAPLSLTQGRGSACRADPSPIQAPQ